MKKFKKFIIMVLIFAVTIESGALVGEAYSYKKNKYCKGTVNGRIVAKIDNLINFSGMASKY